MEVKRKQSLSDFPKNEHFLPPDTHTFGKFDMLCFLVTYVLRFAHLPFYRRNVKKKFNCVILKKLKTFQGY